MDQDLRELVSEYSTAVDTMQTVARELEKPEITDARRSELMEQFKKAHADEQRLNDLTVVKQSTAEARKREAQLFLTRKEDEERVAKGFGRRSNKLSRQQEEDRLDVFVRAMLGEAKDFSDEERQILKKLETRGTDTQVAGTAGLGGYLVPTLLQNEIIKVMKDFSGVLQAARIRYTATGARMTFPKRNTTTRKAQLVSEIGAPNVQDITYTQIVLDAWDYRDVLRVSYNLLQDAEYDFEEEARSVLGEGFGRAMNEHLTTGDASNKAQGVVTGSTLGVTAASATAITLADVLRLHQSVDAGYRNSAKCGYMMHDQLILALQLQSLSATNPYAGTWQPSFADGAPAKINGKMYWSNADMVATPAANAKVMLFGDFDKYNVRIAKDLMIIRNDSLYMGTGEVGYFGFARMDAKLFDDTAIKHYKMAAS